MNSSHMLSNLEYACLDLLRRKVFFETLYDEKEAKFLPFEFNYLCVNNSFDRRISNLRGNYVGVYDNGYYRRDSDYITIGDLTDYKSILDSRCSMSSELKINLLYCSDLRVLKSLCKYFRSEAIDHFNALDTKIPAPSRAKLYMLMDYLGLDHDRDSYTELRNSWAYHLKYQGQANPLIKKFCSFIEGQ